MESYTGNSYCTGCGVSGCSHSVDLHHDYAEEVRNYGQNMYDSASDDGYYENHTEQNWDVADEPEFPGTEDTSNVSDSGGIKNETPRVQGTEQTENESMDVTENTPTPEPTPEPTPTPVPVFTEVPQTEVSKITEYNEEYRLPPTECLQKMRLFYSKSELGKGTEVVIRIPAVKKGTENE